MEERRRIKGRGRKKGDRVSRRRLKSLRGKREKETGIRTKNKRTDEKEGRKVKGNKRKEMMVTRRRRLRR